MVATARGAEIGAFSGSRDSEGFVFVVLDMVGISASSSPCSHENLLLSGDQIRSGVAHRELEATGTLVGPSGTVEVTVEIIDLRIAGQGFLLIPVAPGTSHLPSSEIPARNYLPQA